MPALLVNIRSGAVGVMGARQSYRLGDDGIPGTGGAASSGFIPGLGKGLKGRPRAVAEVHRAPCAPPGSGSQVVINCSGRVRRGHMVLEACFLVCWNSASFPLVQSQINDFGQVQLFESVSFTLNRGNWWWFHKML